MDTRLRRVVKLRLRSPDEALNRRGAILIEDALRTASLPDADGSRLLLIRRLRLGRIRAGSAPSAIALRMEALCRELGELAVHAACSDAAAAPAVYFDDDLEPYTALAVRLAAGEDTSAWFWPLAARGWRPGLPRDEAMRVTLAGALASSAGPAAALALIRTLLRRGMIGPLVSALRPADGAGLLCAFGWTRTQSPFPAAMAAPPSPADLPSAQFAALAAPWFFAWGAEDARSLWLACALYAIERPALMAEASLPRRAAAWVACVCAGREPEAPAEFPARLIFDDDSIRRDRDALPSGSLDLSSVKATPSVTEEIATSPQPAPPSPRPRKGAQHTARAGLFFLVPVMEQLGMSRWMEEHPEMAGWSLPYLVLRDVAVRLETPPGDPVFTVLGEPPDTTPEPVRAAVRAWIRRVRQYTRRTARIGIHSVVCRSGRITASRTHIDVMFRLDRADIRVRRAGLDIDPGWTPCLARVIHFHYLSDEAYDA